MAQPTVDEVIRAYIALRDEKDKIKDRHKEELAPLNMKMEKLEAFMLNLLNTSGTDSMAAKGVGTMFKQLVTSVTVEEWDATLAWIIENSMWPLLERRVSKTVVEEYIASSGEAPPGVKVSQEVEVRVRRS